jgi:amidase
MENKEYSIEELQAMLEEGKVTSRDLVDFYLHRIGKYDGSLNSLADLNNQAYASADALDLERKEKKVRSLLHGIPIVLKDNIFTKGSMRTTVSSYAFSNFYAPYDAFLVKQLKEAGAIILGKANLSEFAYFMSMGKMPSGYGSMHGQVKHPYDSQIDPLGSSTGSAVSVAANLVCASVGTETNGSLMSPAQQNSVVSIKPTVGLVSRSGIVPISYLQDTAGPMARSVRDCAIMLTAMQGKDQEDLATHSMPNIEDYLSACKDRINGLKIGLIDFENYAMDEEELQIVKEAKEVLGDAGAELIDIKYTYDLPNNLLALTHHFKHDLNAFLGANENHTPVKSLLELIRFNNAHAKRCLKYGQIHFLQAEATSGKLKEPEYIEDLHATKKAMEGYRSLFEDYGVDVLMSTKITGYPAVGGLPVMAVPAKALKDKRPISMIFVGEKWQEKDVFSVAYAYEQRTMHRVAPNLDKEKADD